MSTKPTTPEPESPNQEIHPTEARPKESHLPKEPHLIDIGNVADIAQWLVLTVATTTVTTTVAEVTKEAAKGLIQSVRRRFGSGRVAEVSKKAEALADELAETSGLSREEIHTRLKQLIGE